MRFSLTFLLLLSPHELLGFTPAPISHPVHSGRVNPLQGRQGNDGEGGESQNPLERAYNAGRDLRETLSSAIDLVSGGSKGGFTAPDALAYERKSYSQFESEEEIPEVLVVGASGETGRIVVRKLLLRGFRVRVLVRNLYSSTLELLGSGVTYAQGDLTQPQSIVDAVSGVDKVIFCAQARDASQAQHVEYEGFKNLLAAFQDMRVSEYGEKYATKRSIFQFKNQAVRDLWELQGRYSKVSWGENVYGNAQFGSVNCETIGYIMAATAQLDLNLGSFSGLVLRAVGDGQAYRLIVRDEQFASDGIQFETSLPTVPNKWKTHRIPFSSLKPTREGDGTDMSEQYQLDKRKIRQLGVAYNRRPTDPSAFLLSMDYIKAYRTQLEPEFVYISSARVPALAGLETERERELFLEMNPKAFYCAAGEEALRNSGLAYTIVRVESFNNAPGGVQAVNIQQGLEDYISDIARADVADICVSCLLDPSAANLAFACSRSEFAPSAVNPGRDVRSQLAKMRPNA